MKRTYRVVITMRGTVERFYTLLAVNANEAAINALTELGTIQGVTGMTLHEVL